MKPIILESLTPFFLEWYNPEAHCEYHVGIPGHSIEDFALFKDEVQRLIKSGALSFAVVEQLINRAEEDTTMTLTTSNSFINVDENTIECSFQSWKMINATFAEEMRREKKLVCLVGATV